MSSKICSASSAVNVFEELILRNESNIWILSYLKSEVYYNIKKINFK